MYISVGYYQHNLALLLIIKNFVKYNMDQSFFCVEFANITFHVKVVKKEVSFLFKKKWRDMERLDMALIENTVSIV